MFKISKAQVEEVLNYLAQKPYVEVVQIINKLVNLEKYEDSNMESESGK